MKNLMIGFLSLMLTLSVAANEKEATSGAKGKSEAAVALSGTICDLKSGELLAGVEVQIDGTNIKTYTDFDGKFTFDKMAPGAYKLVANYISYKQKVLTVDTGAANEPVEIKLVNP